MKAPYVTERSEGTITMEEMEATIDKMKVRKAGDLMGFTRNDEAYTAKRQIVVTRDNE